MAESVEEKKVGWLELFNDLVFVVAISLADHNLLHIEEDHAEMSIIILKYVLMVIPMWWAWSGQTMFMNRFDHYIKKPELFMVGQMAFVIMMTASFNLDFDKTYYTFLLGYAGIRFLTVVQYYVVYKTADDQIVKNVAFGLGRGMLIGLCLALVSLFFPSPIRYFVMYFGIFLDIILPLTKSNKLTKVPVNMPHLVERIGLLVLVAFGEAMVSIVSILQGHTFDTHMLLYCGVAFIMLVTLWYGYFNNVDEIIDKDVQSNGQVILYSNLVLIVSIMVIAASIDIGNVQLEYNNEIANSFIGVGVLVFILFKHFIFNHYRMFHFSFNKKMFSVLTVAMIILVSIAYFTNMDTILMMALVTIIILLDNFYMYEIEESNKKIASE